MKAIVLTDHFGQGGAERVASLIINGISSTDMSKSMYVYSR